MDKVASESVLDGVNRMYYTRFGTFRIERAGVITNTLHLPDDFNAPAADAWNECDRARQSGEFIPVGMNVEKDLGYIFVRRTQVWKASDLINPLNDDALKIWARAREGMIDVTATDATGKPQKLIGTWVPARPGFGRFKAEGGYNVNVPLDADVTVYWR